MKNGFTLIEIMVAVAVLAILMIGGTFVLLQTLGTRGRNQTEINLNQAGSQALESIEQSIKFGSISTVGSNNRTSCNSAGASGVTGSSAVIKDAFGSTTYSISSSRIASASSTTKYLSSDDVTASNLTFTWFCVSGFSDKLRINFNMTDSGVVRTFSRDINMYNSGI